MMMEGGGEERHFTARQTPSEGRNLSGLFAPPLVVCNLQRAGGTVLTLVSLSLPLSLSIMWRSRPTLIHACRRMSAVDLGTRNTLRSRQVSVSATAHELGPNATASGAFSFELVHRSRKAGSKARVGIIHTPHGDIATPGFVPVATSAALKHLPPSLTPSEGNVIVVVVVVVVEVLDELADSRPRARSLQST